jgi:hypothetical protein
MAVESIPLSLVPLQEWHECPVERGTLSGTLTVPGAGIDIPLPTSDELLSPTGDAAPTNVNQAETVFYNLRLRTDGTAIVNVLFNGATVGTYFLAGVADTVIEIPDIAVQNTTQIRLESAGADTDVIYEFELPRSPVSTPVS